MKLVKYRSKIGKYSGNERLDPSTMEEPDADNDYTAKMWFDDIQADPEFLDDIKEDMVKRYQDIMKMTVPDPSIMDIHMVGESHIDVAWKWRYEQTRQKAIKTFAKAIFHSKKFPNFTFALSEPLLLEWIMEDDPALFEEIKEWVAKGNIELVGGSYVEPDCMMPSGEAFCRMRLYGQRFYREHYNKLATTEWFLDSFGYNVGLPQILIKSGATSFWTSKITWNRQTVFPFVNFWWQGPDGTKILTANFQMGFGGLEKWMLFEMGRRPLTPTGRKVWDYTNDYEEIDEHVEEDEICPLIGCFFGKGDGGHGPTHQEVSEHNALEQVGFAKWSKVGTFYDKLADPKWSDRFPIWNDELYLEYHRGTFSIHSEVKRHNRMYENWMTSFEGLALITSLTNPDYKYPFDTLELMWKVILQNQFHDVLPGSSIPEVYDDVHDFWVQLDSDIDALTKDVSQALSSENNSLEGETDVILYNPVAWKRKSPVFIPISVFENQPSLDTNGKPSFGILTIGDKKYTAQPIAAEPLDSAYPRPAGWWVIPELNGTSSTPGILKLISEAELNDLNLKDISVSESSISNGLLTVKLSKETGAMLEITADGINEGKNILKGDQSNLNFGFLDDFPNDHAWNIKPLYWNYPQDDIKNNENVVLKVVESGPIFSTIEISRILGKEKNVVIQKISLYSECPEVFLEWISPDWKQTFLMLKVLYSTSTNAEIVTSDQAYCALARSTKPQTPCDKARYEKIMHKYCDLSTPDNKWGLAMINEGKYAFDTEVDNESMRLTMLRTARYPTSAGEAWVNEERKMNLEKTGNEIPEFIELGPFKCRYALLPHDGGCLINANGSPNGAVRKSAEQYNQPILVIPGKGIKPSEKLGLSGQSLVETSTPNLVLGVVKPNEWEKNGNLIVRLVEGCGLPADAEIRINKALSQKIKGVKAVDILEREIDADFDWDSSTGMLKLKMSKFEICTFEFEM